jgi:hypothetical protein
MPFRALCRIGSPQSFRPTVRVTSFALPFFGLPGLLND